MPCFSYTIAVDIATESQQEVNSGLFQRSKYHAKKNIKIKRRLGANSLYTNGLRISKYFGFSIGYH